MSVILNLYLIEQDENDDCDTYDSAVVAAESEEAAKLIHPKGDNKEWTKHHYFYVWATKPENVKATLIGLADLSIKRPGIVLASFNAG